MIVLAFFMNEGGLTVNRFCRLQAVVTSLPLSVESSVGGF